MANFRGKEWTNSGNAHKLNGTEITVYQWNSGKNANYLVTCGYQNSNHKEKAFPRGETARDDAIAFALENASAYPCKKSLAEMLSEVM